jgi:hypothetical protein
VGNSGEDVLVYPAASRDVMGVASTYYDTRLSFPQLRFGYLVAAPGEGVVAACPCGAYAAVGVRPLAHQLCLERGPDTPIVTARVVESAAKTQGTR